MVLAYFAIGQDNDYYFLDDDNLFAPTCNSCGYLLDFLGYFNPSFKLKRKIYDMSYTYDGRCIVSVRFKEFCEREGYQGLKFKVFEREPNFFLLIVDNEVKFDSERKGTEFINYCNECGNYESVTGFSPGYLKDVYEELTEGLYRTDLLFGTGNSKHPFIIVAPETKRKMLRESLKGLYFESIEG